MDDTSVQEPAESNTISLQVDYFGQEESVRYWLPDGVSYLDLKIMMEGERRQYLNKSNRGVTLEKGSGDAKLDLAPGDDRYHLLKQAIVGWNLVRDGKALPFGDRPLEEFLKRVNPKVADGIEEKVREINDWLGAETTVEDIDQELERLQELRDRRVKEEAGKANS